MAKTNTSLLRCVSCDKEIETEVTATRRKKRGVYLTCPHCQTFGWFEPQQANAISKRVRQLHKAAKLTQKQLAAALGVKTSYIGGIETQTNFDPKISTLRKLAAAIGCELFDLLRDPE